MFQISQNLALHLSEVSASGASHFSAEILEKDLVISEVLASVFKPRSVNLSIAFGGGTSLVKARGLMDRLSEDIDIKVVRPQNMSMSQFRLQMRLLRSDIAEGLRDAGFSVGIWKAANAGGFAQIEIPYLSRFENFGNIAPTVKLELFSQVELLPASLRKISNLAPLSEGMTSSFELPVVALEETMAQKLVAFLSRIEELDSNPRLVRHLYDIWRIRELEKNYLKVREVFDFSILELGSRKPRTKQQTLTARELLSVAKSLELDERIETIFKNQMFVLAHRPPSYEVAVKTLITEIEAVEGVGLSFL